MARSLKSKERIRFGCTLAASGDFESRGYCWLGMFGRWAIELVQVAAQLKLIRWIAPLLPMFERNQKAAGRLSTSSSKV